MPGPRRIGECGPASQDVRTESLIRSVRSVRVESHDNFRVDHEGDVSAARRPAWVDDFPIPPWADDGPVAPRESLHMRVDLKSGLDNEKAVNVQVGNEIEPQLVVAEEFPTAANHKSLSKSVVVEDCEGDSARSSSSAAKSRSRRLIASVSARLVRWKPPGMPWRRKPIVNNQPVCRPDPELTPVLSCGSVEKSVGPLDRKIDTELPACYILDVPDEIPLPKAKGLPAGGIINGYHTTSCQGEDSNVTASATGLDNKVYRSHKLKTPRQTMDVEKMASSDKSMTKSLAPKLGDIPYHADVALAVYSLNGASAVNKITEFAGLGGAYHVGIEIFCLEWSYGWCPHGTGVHNVYAGCSDLGTFKERVVLGRTPCTPNEVISILGELRESWSGASYNLLQKNCAHFTMEFVERLHVSKFPDWVNSLPSLLRWLTEWLGTPVDETVIDPRRTSAPANFECDADEALVASELDWVEAQGYMLERAADAARVWSQKRTAKQ